MACTWVAMDRRALSVNPSGSAWAAACHCSTVNSTGR